MTHTRNIIVKKVCMLCLIAIAGFLTSFINSFSNQLLIVVLPGVLLGQALTIPHIDFSKRHLVEITTFTLILTGLWLLFMALGLGFSLLNKSDNDSTGVIIIGLLSAVLFTYVLDKYYPISNKLISYPSLAILGLSGSLLADYLFPTPNLKELNMGKILFIWEMFIGLGLTIFVKFQWMKKA